MQQIYRRKPMPKCDFNKVAKQLYWNHTSAWVFSCNFAAYFQNSFFKEHLWVAASVFLRTMMKLSKIKNCWCCIFKSVLIKDRILHHWGRRKWVSICFYFIINVVCIYIKYFFDVVRNKTLKISTRVNQNRSKNSWIAYFTWTRFEFWPIINIFRKP